MTASATARKRLRLIVQTVVSVALIAFLVHLGRHEHLLAAWAHIGPGGLLLAGGCFAVAAVLSARRWQMFLRYQSIREPLASLTELYCIGLFCSLFLPTAAGGDAYRVFEVSRRGWPVARVLLATLQERLLGLGATMLVGFVAALWFHAELPGDLLASVLGLFAAGVLAVTCVLYLGPLLGRARRVLSTTRLAQADVRLRQWPPVSRLAGFLQPLREAPALSVAQVLRMLLLALATFAAAVAMYAVVCDSLGVPFDWLEMCLIVSVVGVVRMLPISLGGIGVGEAAFVGMMGLFGVAKEKAAPVALVLLGVSTVMSLLGGGFALRRMLWGMRVTSHPQDSVATEVPTVFSFPANVSERREVQRHAA